MKNLINEKYLFRNNLAIFATFYVVALWLEMAENWETPWATFLGLILLVGVIASGIDRIKFWIFVVLNTLYTLYFHFPDVANHVNLIVFCNLFIVVVAVYSWLFPERFSQPEAYYKAIASPVRLSLIAVYFWAGFHKLNTDFFSPQFSCSNSMFLGIIEMLTSTIFGIPVVLFLGAIAFIFVKNVIPQNVWHQVLQNRRKILVASIVSLILITGILIYLNSRDLVFPLFILATSIVVLIWELVGGIALFIPKWQLAMFLFSLFMHLVLSPIGFVDFGSLAFALWLTFIPSNYYSYLSQSVRIPLINLRLNRILLYVVINIIGGLISGIYYLAYPKFNINAIAGILFIISVLIVIAPLIKNILISPNSWGGVAVIDRQMPKFMYVFIALLFLYAATPYLGLRTAGNFSMFSNLRTEGVTSNHLLLGSNPLKIWNYQEDVVKVIEIDDKKAEIGHKYRPLKNHSIPVVEFKKLIYQWTKARYRIPLTFEYNNRIYTTTDIVNEPQWRTSQRNWEMFLMDFRVIQPDNGEPNYCRW
jgi:hypothetical protein